MNGNNGATVPKHVVILEFENVREIYYFLRRVAGVVMVTKMNFQLVIGIAVVTIHLGINGTAEGLVQTILNFVQSRELDLCVIEADSEYQSRNVQGCVKQKRLIKGAPYSAVSKLVWSGNGLSGGVAKVSVCKKGSSIEQERFNGSRNVGQNPAPRPQSNPNVMGDAVLWIAYWETGVCGLNVTLHVESDTKQE